MIPMWIKIPYTVFVLVLVPVYWIKLGPQNFFWACDIALIATVFALWLESRLLASTMAIAVILPELVWNLDFFTRLAAGHDVIGLDLTGYMFSQENPPLLRNLSLFHVFLGLLLIWLVYRLGYDRRAIWVQTLITWTVLPMSYWFTDPARNINFVHGIGNLQQTWLPGPVWVGLLMVLFPMLVYIPTHLALKSFFAHHAHV